MAGAFCLGIFGIVFLIIDIYCIIKMVEYFSIKKNGVCCSGKVIRLDKAFSKAGYVYTPWYEYTTETGEYFCKKCRSSTSFKNAFPVGKRIKIYYDKNDPDTDSLTDSFISQKKDLSDKRIIICLKYKII